MEYFHHTVNYVSERLLQKHGQPEPIVVGQADAYLNFVVRVVTWDDPKLTWILFLVLNMLFVIVIYYEIRFYCFVCSAVLLWVLLDLRGEVCNFKQQPTTISCQSLNDYFRSCVSWLKALKHDNPSMFCWMMVVVFLSLSFVGRTISGQLLSYLVLLAIFFGPYLLSLTPDEYKRRIRHFLASMRNTEGVVAETELIPFIKDFTEEHDPDQDSLLTDQTQDSVPNSFISGMTSMPSYLEADVNVDDLEEDDLLPQSHPPSRAYSAVEYSSDSDSNIEFDAAHFKKDSASSSDEDCADYTKGLKFSDVTLTNANVRTTTTATATTTALPTILSMGTNLLSNVIQKVAATATGGGSGETTKRRDSDSDFEIINSEDAEET